MIQGSWVGDLLLVSFVFPFSAFHPLSASVAQDEFGCFTPVSRSPSFSFHFSCLSFLDIDAH